LCSLHLAPTIGYVGNSRAGSISQPSTSSSTVHTSCVVLTMAGDTTSSSPCPGHPVA
jgi:hypothetical protein